MKVKLYAEVEVSDQALVTAFGATIAEVAAKHTIENGLCKATTHMLKGMAHVTRAEVIWLPELLP